MKQNYKLAIFDLDGTILDTTEGVLAAVKHTIQVMGYEMLDEKQLSTFIGPPIQDSFAHAYGLQGDILQEIAGIFRDRYKDVDLLKAKPYPEIFTVFEGLLDRNVMPAIATYKREDYAKTLLKHFGFDRYTHIIYGADHENKLKKKDIIEKCITEAGIADRNQVVMIGDTLHDAGGAQQMGIDFIGVTFGFGFHSPEDLNGVKAVGSVERPIDLLNYF